MIVLNRNRTTALGKPDGDSWATRTGRHPIQTGGGQSRKHSRRIRTRGRGSRRAGAGPCRWNLSGTSWCGQPCEEEVQNQAITLCLPFCSVVHLFVFSPLSLLNILLQVGSHADHTFPLFCNLLHDPVKIQVVSPLSVNLERC